MTGLDKIIQDIKKDSDARISSIMEETRKEKDKIDKQAENEAAEKCAEIDRRAKEQAEAVKERALSSAALQRKREVLSAKQKIIYETIEKAKESIYKLPDNEYFGIILKMIGKYAPKANGEIIFSEADKKRLPEGFAGDAETAAKKAGAKLTISDETRGIDGGFVLSYGGVEENCSFEALFDAKHDELQDKVNEILFSGG